MTLYCPKHPRYRAELKPRTRRLCWCWILYFFRAYWPWFVAVGRPVIHRRRDLA